MIEKTFILKIFLIVLFIGLIFRWINVKAENSQKYIAIIIDDFGNNSAGTEEMLNLPIKFTGAVMPQMPNSEEESDRLKSLGKEVILHQPMEAHTGQRSWLGPVPILSTMTADEAAEQFKENAETLDPKGFNNHMGSLITEDKQKMTAILKTAKEKNMFFTDSVTTGKSIAEETAKELDIPYLKRDVFLDSTHDVGKIQKNLLKTAEIANKKGYAIAIGHVGAEGGIATAQAINSLYKSLEDKGYKFVTVSELLQELGQL